MWYSFFPGDGLDIEDYDCVYDDGYDEDACRQFVMTFGETLPSLRLLGWKEEMSIRPASCSASDNPFSATHPGDSFVLPSFVCRLDTRACDDERALCDDDFWQVLQETLVQRFVLEHRHWMQSTIFG